MWLYSFELEKIRGMVMPSIKTQAGEEAGGLREATGNHGNSIQWAWISG